MKKIILILSILTLIFVTGCVTKQYQNPSCKSNEDCSALSENAVCIDGTCQLPNDKENCSMYLIEDEAKCLSDQEFSKYCKDLCGDVALCVIGESAPPSLGCLKN